MTNETQEAVLHAEFQKIFAKLQFMQLEHDTRVLAAALLGYSSNMYSLLYTSGSCSEEGLKELFAEALADASTKKAKVPEVAYINSGDPVTKQ